MYQTLRSDVGNTRFALWALATQDYVGPGADRGLIDALLDRIRRICKEPTVPVSSSAEFALYTSCNTLLAAHMNTPNRLWELLAEVEQDASDGGKLALHRVLLKLTFSQPMRTTEWTSNLITRLEFLERATALAHETAVEDMVPYRRAWANFQHDNVRSRLIELAAAHANPELRTFYEAVLLQWQTVHESEHR